MLTTGLRTWDGCRQRRPGLWHWQGHRRIAQAACPGSLYLERGEGSKTGAGAACTVSPGPMWISGLALGFLVVC